MQAKPTDAAVVAVARNNMVACKGEKDLFDAFKHMRAAHASNLDRRLNLTQRQVIATNNALVRNRHTIKHHKSSPPHRALVNTSTGQPQQFGPHFAMRLIADWVPGRPLQYPDTRPKSVFQQTHGVGWCSSGALADGQEQGGAGGDRRPRRKVPNERAISPAVRKCLCLVYSAAFAAKKAPLLCVFRCLLG